MPASNAAMLFAPRVFRNGPPIGRAALCAECPFASRITSSKYLRVADKAASLSAKMKLARELKELNSLFQCVTELMSHVEQSAGREDIERCEKRWFARVLSELREERNRISRRILDLESHDEYAELELAKNICWVDIYEMDSAAVTDEERADAAHLLERLYGRLSELEDAKNALESPPGQLAGIHAELDDEEDTAERLADIHMG